MAAKLDGKLLLMQWLAAVAFTRAARGPTLGNLRAEAVVKRRRTNWPHLSQEVTVSQAHYLPLFRKGGGQREVGV